MLGRFVPAVLLLLGPGCASAPPGEGRPPAPVRLETHVVPDSDVTFTLAWIEEGSFWIGVHEVTWDEYLVWCRFDQALPEGVDARSRPSKPLDVHPYDRHWGAGRRPAVGMSRNAALRYCRWLSERTGRVFDLPTEEEWLLAAGPAPVGAELEGSAWFQGNSQGKTWPVGSKAPGPRGLHDVYGNLWEYCKDPYSPDLPALPVLRGGSWKDPATTLTAEARLAFDPDWTLDDPGFPPGVWWIPDGDHLGFRLLLRPSDEP